MIMIETIGDEKFLVRYKDNDVNNYMFYSPINIKHIVSITIDSYSDTEWFICFKSVRGNCNWEYNSLHDCNADLKYILKVLD
jgi:hypothetical protein